MRMDSSAFSLLSSNVEAQVYDYLNVKNCPSNPNPTSIIEWSSLSSSALLNCLTVVYLSKAFANEAIGDSAVDVTLKFELRMCQAPHKVYMYI